MFVDTLGCTILEVYWHKWGRQIFLPNNEYMGDHHFERTVIATKCKTFVAVT